MHPFIFNNGRLTQCGSIQHNAGAHDHTHAPDLPPQTSLRTLTTSTHPPAHFSHPFAQDSWCATARQVELAALVSHLRKVDAETEQLAAERAQLAGSIAQLKDHTETQLRCVPAEADEALARSVAPLVLG